jgi:hypothetical protein
MPGAEGTSITGAVRVCHVAQVHDEIEAVSMKSEEGAEDELATDAAMEAVEAPTLALLSAAKTPARADDSKAPDITSACNAVISAAETPARADDSKALDITPACAAVAAVR